MPPDYCKILRRVCLHQTALVSFDPDFHASYDPVTNRSELRPPLPYLHTWRSSWNIPGAMNSDAIVGNQDAYLLTVRPASRLEASPHLQPPSPEAPEVPQEPEERPAFSRCTVPVVLLTEWPFNFCEFFVNGAASADLLFRKLQMLPDGDVTLALALPAGLGLMPYHQALLSHLSIRPITTLEKMAAEAEATSYSREGGGGGARVTWSHDGIPRSCFKRVLVCKLERTDRASPLETAAAVAAHMDGTGGPLPEDPLGFGAAAAAVASGSSSPGVSQPPPSSPPLPPLREDDTLRVAIETRHGGSRTIRNLHQLVEACHRMDWKEVAGFRRVVCRPLITYDTPQLYGLDRFRATVAAVRSSHILVAVHGAGAANGFFLRPDGDRQAAAVLEVRPCGFGSGFPWWVDVHMALNLPRLGDAVRFHAYNIEDPTQCSPSDWELDIRTGTGAVNTRAGGGHFARDQHLTLRPDGFMAMVRHVASMLRNREAYDMAKAANRLHGYALPGEAGEGGEAGKGSSGLWGRSGGVVLGPLGMGNFTEHAASGTAVFVLSPE
ncbi:hypothetical protein VOLCADRAFT_106000 [Volvox carteri f. nagariensis]|uniref:Uncharacterized protein n=1 Tax=Volvox carteri f. nagariensis TaxID=3068 RepID=D8U470_VOLCA|nr:uncharacterized protein VOLCADRAFT_106000 [Volvox carteri f. nagariensis]EFJ45450.1 hypothetical protein VOLCADRAFT_106000 [Volvox carteri f. nagariensis]|eukprot:XP_002953477.1 hypothetical protein VOLCADRAFT_106000 [Volvox carteri f. nagariensis]